ncbi:unnamed protein product [Didymodactylos carnosus]|uniref:Uncharacterized protein n=1 Tax=Didymodactylos carnosus TaxID=1234261 RepID=A0A814AJJ3_9BILA|nr:unnamed protein product [Didymodactylos carnosus]CAF0927867.1 unnamed protein product [Didymodactylos carnosus]CAF3694957.1 unnamed protein product [Didymodactylos carnosus]CAF3704761.1 unnamed protein product [Didymodactylos carnosus]
MTLCCIETDDTICQTLPCLPSLIKWNITTMRDDNNNNIQPPVKEEPLTFDNDVRHLMSALGLKSKPQQKQIETLSKSLVRVPLPITPFKRRTRKRISTSAELAMPLCLLNLNKFDIKDILYFVVFDLWEISIIKLYEEYCATENIDISLDKQIKTCDRLITTSTSPIYFPRRRDTHMKRQVQYHAILRNAGIRPCTVLLHRLNSPPIENLLPIKQFHEKSNLTSLAIKQQSKTAITTTVKVKKLRSRKKKYQIKRSPSPSNENKPQSIPSTFKRKALPSKSPCDLTELTNSNTTKRQKTITVNNSDYLIENMTKAPLLQTAHLSKFDSICLKCFICNIRQVLSFDTLAYDLHSHWQLHKKSNITYNIYDTVMDKKCFRMVEYFIPSQQPAMEGKPLDIFITHGKELQQEQMVIISDDENEDIICLD